MAVMTRMVNQESELKKEAVREGYILVLRRLVHRWWHGRATRKNYVKSPVGYGPDLGAIAYRF
jgi:hypothetical protein